MRKLDKILRLSPVIVFYIVTVINLLFLFVPFTDPLNMFFKINELAGNSILFSLILWLIAKRHGGFYYNYIAVAGLLVSGLTNMSFMYFPIGESAYKELILLGSMIPFSVVVAIFQSKRI